MSVLLKDIFSPSENDSGDTFPKISIKVYPLFFKRILKLLTFFIKTWSVANSFLTGEKS